MPRKAHENKKTSVSLVSIKIYGEKKLSGYSYLL
jgi:hypothetical protein